MPNFWTKKDRTSSIPAGMKRRPRYIISYGFADACKKDAEHFAKRIAKGKPARGAKGGPVKHYTAEELAAYATEHGLNPKSK